MRFHHVMTLPAPRKKTAASKLFPIIGGVVFFSVVALFEQRVALALAIGAIGFAGVSMLTAILRK